MYSIKDHEYMAVALGLAAEGLYTTHPNPRVGCVLVNGNNIVGRGAHLLAGQQHAEIIALTQAGGAAAGSTVYLTLEPCSHHGKTPPCVDALINAGVKRVVIAAQDPNPQVNGAGISRLSAAGIDVSVGLMEAQSKALNPGFFLRMQAQRPYVRVKLAMSVDGRTALSSGESRWITGESARLDVQRWRARSSAVMTAVGTVLADDPALNVRLESLVASGEINSRLLDKIPQPLRIVLDSQLRIPPDARMLKLPGDILIVAAIEDKAKSGNLVADNVEVIRVAADPKGRASLREVMSVLAAAEVNEVLVEAGHELSGALLAAGMVDELVLYIAPCVLGDTAKGLFKIPALKNMQAKMNLEFIDMRLIGKDIRIIAKPQY